jgi:hypothetical protein
MIESPAQPVTIHNSYGDYQGNVNTPWWKVQCQMLPCALAMAWPQYATAIVEVELAGEPAVIQVWKGLCEEGLPSVKGYDFPGGVGAEVGVYSRKRPTGDPSFPLVGPAWTAWLSARLGEVTDVWWPAPQLVNTVSYTLTEPSKGVDFFSASSDSYWTCTWMDSAFDYVEWAGKFSLRHLAVPAAPQDFTIDFTITDAAGTDHRFTWGAHNTPITRPAAVSAY